MNCPNCGSPIEPSATFCTNCGIHLTNIPPEQPTAVIPKEYKPISPWGYSTAGTTPDRTGVRC